jgi:hypothetical protein
MRDRVSHPFKITGAIIVLFLLIFREDKGFYTE